MSLCYFAGEFKIRERLTRDDKVTAGNAGPADNGDNTRNTRNTVKACAGRAALNPAFRRAGFFADIPKEIVVCGVLTGIKRNNRGIVLSARISDPTGVFLLNFGNDRADCARVISGMEVPSFVSVGGVVTGLGTKSARGRAALIGERAAGSEGCDCIIHPYSVSPSTKESRERWVLQTADETADRMESLLKNAGGLSADERSAAAEICALAKSAVIAVCAKPHPAGAGAGAGAGEDAEGVCGGTEGASSNADENPDELILSIIEENSTKKGILRDDFYAVCAGRNISREVAEECVNRLVEDGTLYLPKGGYIKIL